MKRLPHIAMLLVAVALVAADKGEKKKKTDFEKIQGKWNDVEYLHKGKKIDTGPSSLYTFSGKKLTIVDLGAVRKSEGEGVIELRPDKKPPEMDLILTRDGEKITMKTIYELSGDTLKICAVNPGVPRPDAVGTAVDDEDERRLMVLKRVKSDEKK